jgi:hypothetical protein
VKRKRRKCLQNKANSIKKTHKKHIKTFETHQKRMKTEKTRESIFFFAEAFHQVPGGAQHQDCYLTGPNVRHPEMGRNGAFPFPSISQLLAKLDHITIWL